MLSRLGRFIYRARWATLVTSLLIVVAAVLYGFGGFSSLKGNGFTDPVSESSRAQVVLDTKLGGAAPDVVVLMYSATLKATDPAFAQAATQMLAKVQARSEVASVISYYSIHSIELISRDGHETFATVQLRSQDDQIKTTDFNAIKGLMTSPTLQVTLGGTLPVNNAINSQIGSDIEHAEIITFPILAILLLFVFGGVVAASLPLLIGGIAIVGAFAALRVITTLTDVSVFAINIVTILGLGLAIDYSLFIVTRFREELACEQDDVRGALLRTMRTAGRTVLFSGLTVSTSLLGLLLFPQVFLRSMGEGAIAAVLIALLASLTILPALLALLGRRVNALSLTRLFRRRTSPGSAARTGTAWYRLSTFVMRWPVPVALVVIVLLVAIGLPFLRVSFATPDASILPQGQPARVVSEHLTRDFAQRGNAQIVIAIQTNGDALSPANLAALDTYTRSLKAIPGVIEVGSLVTIDPSLSLTQYQQLYAHPEQSPQLAVMAQQYAHGDTTKITIAIQPVEHSTGAQTIVTTVRSLKTTNGLVALVDGTTATQMDLLSSLGSVLPRALGLMVVAIFVLLFLMTGSLLVPLKAILLNTLSLSATFGALVWIFQDGHLHTLLNFTTNGSIDATQPVLIFAVAFGLSMDYEVFLLSRIKEQYDATGDNRLAVATGIQQTGWLITSAAALLAVVVGAFGTAHIIFIQEIGIGLALAVIMDATLIRMLLVPATMRLLGNWNWWAPAPLHALWLHIGLSEDSAGHPAPVLPEEKLEPATH